MYSKIRFPKSYAYQLMLAGIFALFFFLFALIYRPGAVYAFYADLPMGYLFHISILMCIVLLSVILTRLIFWVLLQKYKFDIWQYIVYCVVEIAVSSMFVALYDSLFTHELYFDLLPAALLKTFLLLIYPYSMATVIRIAMNRKEDLSHVGEKDTLIKFVDENKKLKLTVEANIVLYIAAYANYVKINYLENGSPKEFLLRNSMKNISTVAEKHGLVRCHRSYFVNPKHIKALSKNKEGIITAELKEEGLMLLPVSKLYYESLSELL